MEQIFFSRLKKIRTDRGLSQPNVAKQMALILCDKNFRQQHYSRIETGKGEPTLRQLMAICRTFSISADWLLGLSEEPNQQSQSIGPSLDIRLEDVKRNAEQATASINALQTAIEKLNRTI